MRITITDVAKEANVSTVTASRAFSNPDVLALKTRSHVLQVAERLGYIPNRRARSLRNGKTQTIAVLTTGLRQPLNTLKVDALQQEIMRHGYQTLLLQYRAEEYGKGWLLAECQDVIDGLVLCCLEGGPPPSEISALIQAGIAVVSLENYSGLSLDVVTADREVGSHLAVEHLVRQGHKEIALAQIVLDSEVVGRRAFGYQNAMRAVGCQPIIVSDRSTGRSAFDDGYSLMKKARASKIYPTAWVFSDDELAVGAIKAFQEWGVRVPQEVAIVGWDNTPLCDYATPPLTSITQPIQECVQRLVARLLDRINGSVASAEVTLIPPKLVIRTSCGAAINRPVLTGDGDHSDDANDSCILRRSRGSSSPKLNF